MKEYILEELGYFTERECKKIADIMQHKTYMDFEIAWSNMASNCTLIVITDYDATEKEIKEFFISCLIRESIR